MQPKKTIFYTFHLGNFLLGLLKSQQRCRSKYRGFYTAYLHTVVRALFRAGLINCPQLIKNFNFFSIALNKKSDFLKIKRNLRGAIVVGLKYFNEVPLITAIKFYSTPGRRLFLNKVKVRKLIKVSPGSLIFLSTSSGIISHYDAATLGIGGLLLFRVN